MVQHEEDREQEQEETVQPGAEEGCGEYIIQVSACPRFTLTRMRDLEVSCVSSLVYFVATVQVMALHCVFFFTYWI